jgi:uncharacterized protein YidB (DUF937 family)
MNQGGNMGLLDDLAGRVLGGRNTQTDLVNALLGILSQQSGGLAGLTQQFAGKGLGDIVNSWVGTGKNLPITQQQIHQVLGGDIISQLASKTGISTDKVTSQLTDLLPNIIDKLTPDGQIPKDDIASKGMSLLNDLLK